jgi:hypothetical protein
MQNQIKKNNFAFPFENSKKETKKRLNQKGEANLLHLESVFSYHPKESLKKDNYIVNKIYV